MYYISLYFIANYIMFYSIYLIILNHIQYNHVT